MVKVLEVSKDAYIEAYIATLKEAAISSVPFGSFRIGRFLFAAKAGKNSEKVTDAAKKGEDILVLGRQSGLEEAAKREGGRLSSTASRSAKDIFKQNSSDIRKADKIIFFESNVPRTLDEALKIGGGQFSRSERTLIRSRKELLKKTDFKKGT